MEYVCVEGGREGENRNRSPPALLPKVAPSMPLASSLYSLPTLPPRPLVSAGFSTLPGLSAKSASGQRSRADKAERWRGKAERGLRRGSPAGEEEEEKKRSSGRRPVGLLGRQDNLWDWLQKGSAAGAEIAQDCAVVLIYVKVIIAFLSGASASGHVQSGGQPG